MQHGDLDGRRIEVQTIVDDLSREQRKAETEVEQVRTRRTRDDDRLNSGAISNPKDLENLQHELSALERRIGVLEEAELEIMEQLESAESDLATVLGQVAEVDREIDVVEAEKATALAELDAQGVDVSADRDDLVVRVPAELLALYEKLRGQYGSGAAPLRARRCEGCRLELNGADLREITMTDEDTLVRCPECSRILVRTNESGL